MTKLAVLLATETQRVMSQDEEERIDGILSMISASRFEDAMDAALREDEEDDEVEEEEDDDDDAVMHDGEEEDDEDGEDGEDGEDDDDEDDGDGGDEAPRRGGQKRRGESGGRSRKSSRRR